MKKIAILGSTGSIGTQALDICARHPEEYRVTALTANRSREKLFDQVRRFRPEMAGLAEGISREEIPEDLRFCRWLSGPEALRAAAAEVEADQVLVSIVGIAGLQSVMDALGAGRQVLLANKEALVTGGHLVMDLAGRMGKPILPVDSEHSAIFQCLQAAGPNRPTKLLLTASGGPFRTWEKDRIAGATKEMALKHPRWSMGAKITIDSATMMNKGFEVIEACWLFDMPPGSIRVLVHPESIIHSMIAFEDGAVLAQLACPDMRQPIQFALGFPERHPLSGKKLDLAEVGALHFFPTDPEKFPALGLAREAVRRGGNVPCALNAANEAAVAAFLHDRIPFYGITDTVRAVLEDTPEVKEPTLEDIFETHRDAFRRAEAYIRQTEGRSRA